MPNYTEKYNLVKPLGSENYNVANDNGNMDIIETFHINHKITPGGTSDAITGNVDNLKKYYDGLGIDIPIISNNTGPTTLNINGMGAKNVKKIDLSGIKQDLEANDLIQGNIVQLKYDGTDFTVYGNLGKTNAQLADLSQPQTLPLSTQSPVTSFPTGTLDGAVQDLVIEGQTLVNSVENGDFSDGTTGWSEVNSSLSESNNVLSITGDGSGASPRGRQVDTKVNASTGDLIFLYAKVRITNSESTQIYYGLDGITDELIVQSNPTQDEWYELYGIAVANEDNEYIITFRHYYVDSATANGKVMEVDGNAGVFAINMTQLGIESYTEEQMLEICRNGYFEDVTSVKNLTLEARGKNKFDLSKVKVGEYSSTTGGVTDILSTTDLVFYEDGISFSTSGNFNGIYVDDILYFQDKLYLKIFNTNTNFNRLLINVVDVHGNFISYLGAFTYDDAVNGIDIGGQYITISIVNSGGYSEYRGMTLSPLPLTEYEPYKSSILKLDKPMRSVPNGVKDTVENGKVYNRIEKDVTELKGATGWTISDDDGTNHAFRINLKTLLPNSVTDAGSLGLDLTIGNVHFSTISINNNTENTIYLTSGDTLRIKVNKITFPDVATWENHLANNQVSLIYQLAEPIITDFNGVLNAYEDGDLVQYCAYDKAHTIASTTITLDSECSSIEKITRIVDGEEVEVTGWTLDDSTTISGLPEADTYLVQGTLSNQILANITMNCPVNTGAVIGSLNESVNTLQKKNTEQDNLLNMIIAGM